MKANADDSDGPLVRAVANSLKDMERMKPGSSEVFVTGLLQRLGRFAEFLPIAMFYIAMEDDCDSYTPNLFKHYKINAVQRSLH